MHIINFIKEKGLEALTTELGIVVKEGNGLLCFNYDQIESPRLHPVVLESRGLILEKDTLNIVFRSMLRFFNYGENDTKSLDFSKAKYYDKVDGSLIKIYNYKSRWYIATRGTIEATTETPFGITFKGLVLKALNMTEEEFQYNADLHLNPNLSYNCEVTSIENRIVTRYEGYTLHFLNALDTQTGVYVNDDGILKLGGKQLKPLYEETPTLEKVLADVNSLKNLKEGYIAYIDDVPVCKFKNVIYVELHSKRGEGMCPKAIRNIVMAQEHPEYLSYFPEDTPLFEPYILAYENLFKQVQEAWDTYKDINDQKEFAISVKDFIFKSLLFTKRSNPSKTFYSIFNQCLTQPGRHRLLEDYKNG